MSERNENNKSNNSRVEIPEHALKVMRERKARLDEALTLASERELAGDHQGAETIRLEAVLEANAPIKGFRRRVRAEPEVIAERVAAEDALPYRELGSVSMSTAFDHEFNDWHADDLPKGEEEIEAFIEAQLDSYGRVFRPDGARLDLLDHPNDG